MIGRRELLSGAALLTAAGLKAGAAASQTVPPKPSREQRLSTLAGEHRRRILFDGSRFSGPGYDWLVGQGRAAHFFLLGEEHGIAENPKLAAQLFTALAPAGYSKVSIEISAPMAEEIDRALTRGGAEGLRRLLADPGSAVAFYGMREEAEWLAAAQRAIPGGERFLWGTDYDIAADRRLIQILKAKRKPTAASAALAMLERASSGSWAKYAETKSPQYIFGFAGDPDLVRAVRAAWPKPDAEALWILDTLQETFEINQLWVAGRPWESNQRRGAFMRSNFLRHWRAEKKGGHAPRVFLKYGASHVVRGRNSTETFDLGSLVPEIAAIENGKAFSMLVLPGAGSSVASFDPTSFKYRSARYDGVYQHGLEPILSQAWQDTMTLFDTHPLRPLLGYSKTPADPDLLRVVHGFDAILIMSGSTPSSNL